MKKNHLILSALFLVSCISVTGCKNTGNSTSQQEYEDYYTIDVSSISKEVLKGSIIDINPSFKNLGDEANPNFSVIITCDGEDVTDEVYDIANKTFNAKNIGTYELTITVLNKDGGILTTASGKTFSKRVIIDVVIQSFEAINAAGSDIVVSEDENGAFISFGESYATSPSMVDSGQYKVTGISFNGSYSITYKLEDVVHSPTYHDPSFYFGWTRDDADGHDDCLKVCAGNGAVATWIWDGSAQADLSHNKENGWTLNNWYNSAYSVSDNNPISGDHYLTFERFVNEETNTAIYGIKFDGNPITYLNIKDNYTDVLRNVWVESVNVQAKISVSEYKAISDSKAPTLVLDYMDYDQTNIIKLNDGATVTDDSGYGNILVTKYTVTSPSGENVELENSKFEATEVGTYKVNASVTDLMGNTTTAEGTITVNEKTAETILLSLDETSSVARTNTGIIVYYSATKNEEEYKNATLKAYKGDNLDNAIDVTDSVLRVHTAKTADMSFDVFEATEAGNYILTLEAEGKVISKNITVTNTCGSIYGYSLFESPWDHVTIGRGEFIYDGVTATEKTGKLGLDLHLTTNFELSFDVTDLTYVAQGKLGFTVGISTASKSWVGWEDITIGGNVNNDLWGFETCAIGAGWVSYQWRSNWQNKTTEFMPNPEDPTIGCGREAGAYTQYATGTHNYKVVCTTDAEGMVTYTYYIDNEIEAIHKLPAGHRNANSTDHFQIWCEKMNGIVTNVTLK